MTYELFNMQGYVLALLLGAIGVKMCTCRRRLRGQPISLVSVELLCNYSESHLFSICLEYLPHTQSVFRAHGLCVQASLTLNHAQADSNFCPQITFQRPYKSAESSCPASISLFLLLILQPCSPPVLLFTLYFPPV